MAQREKLSTGKKKNEDRDFFSLFTANETKTGKIVLKPKLNKFGVSCIKVYTNDEEEIILDEDTEIWGTKREGMAKATGKPYYFWDFSIALEK